MLVLYLLEIPPESSATEISSHVRKTPLSFFPRQRLKSIFTEMGNICRQRRNILLDEKFVLIKCLRENCSRECHIKDWA
jgi:hypothetical protein